MELPRVMSDPLEAKIAFLDFAVSHVSIAQRMPLLGKESGAALRRRAPQSSRRDGAKCPTPTAADQSAPVIR
jgi:hypothetical protein